MSDITVTPEQIARIMKAKIFIGAKMDALDHLLGDTFAEYVGRELGEIQDVLLDICGIPSENEPFTEEEIEEVKKECAEDFRDQVLSYGYCRDSVDEIFCELSKKIDPQKDCDNDESIDAELLQEIYLLCGEVPVEGSLK